MKNIIVSIGNTDDKLAQREWAEYVRCVGDELYKHETRRHFFGGSETWAKWQNVAWLSVIAEGDIERVKVRLAEVRKQYMQGSLFFMAGDGEFI